MVQLTGYAGPQRAPSGGGVVGLGDLGEVMTNDMNGRWYEQVIRGNAFHWSTAIAGVALVAPVATTAANPALVVPSNLRRSLSIQKITFNRTAVGTPLEGGVVYTYHRASTIVGTAADVVSGTVVAGVNARLDKAASDDSGVIWVPTGIVYTGTPTFFSNAGFAQTADDGATTVSGPRAEMLTDYVDGGIVVPPGWSFQICGNVAFNTTYAISVFGIMVPMPSYFV